MILKIMKKWYSSLNIEKKEIFWLVVVALLGLVATTPLFFIDIPHNYSYFFGWLLGSIAEVFGFLTIVFMGNSMEESAKAGNSKSGILAAFTGIFRFLFYAAVLVVAAICTYRSHWFNGFDAFNFWTCFGALVPMQFVLFIFHLLHKEDKPNNASGASK